MRLSAHGQPSVGLLHVIVLADGLHLGLIGAGNKQALVYWWVHRVLIVNVTIHLLLCGPPIVVVLARLI